MSDSKKGDSCSNNDLTDNNDLTETDPIIDKSANIQKGNNQCMNHLSNKNIFNRNSRIPGIGEADLNPFHNNDLTEDRRGVPGSMASPEDIKRIVKESSKDTDDMNPFIRKSYIAPSKNKKAGSPDPDTFNPGKFNNYFE